ncbi:MAG: MotA/TolQ/ExbB proton channel family protein [Spirochaetales bacterium]|nr:MotA/TolQ/ExbB proton channel family protein [Spirochaetales bacterium]
MEILSFGFAIMVILGILSIIAVAFIIDRLLYFRKIRVNEEQLVERLKGVIKKGHFDEAISICDNNPSPVANLMKVGIEHRHLPKKEVEDVIMSAANREIPKMERFISALGTIAHVAPLLGLLGTVTGIIGAFGVIGGNAGLAGDPAAFASSISGALFTTAGGMVVAIPTIIFYNFLVNKVNHTIINLENRVKELVIYIGG